MEKIIYFLIIVISVSGLLIFADQKAKCEDSGKVFVAGVFWYECVRK